MEIFERGQGVQSGNGGGHTAGQEVHHAAPPGMSSVTAKEWDKRLVRTFSVLTATQKKGNGGVVCTADTLFPIDESNCYIPSNIL